MRYFSALRLRPEGSTSKASSLSLSDMCEVRIHSGDRHPDHHFDPSPGLPLKAKVRGRKQNASLLRNKLCRECHGYSSRQVSGKFTMISPRRLIDSISVLSYSTKVSRWIASPSILWQDMRKEGRDDTKAILDSSQPKRRVADTMLNLYDIDRIIDVGICQIPECKKPVLKNADGTRSHYCSIAHEEFRTSRLLDNVADLNCDMLIGWPKTRAYYVVRHESKVTDTSVGLGVQRKHKAKLQ